MAFYSKKIVSDEFVGPTSGTASFATSASTAFSASTSVLATAANNFAVSGSLTVTGSSTFDGTASFTNLGPISQPVLRVTRAIQLGNAKRPSVNDAFVFGNETEVSGGYGVAVGAFTHVAGTANASFVAGQNNSASAFFQHVVGQFNQNSDHRAAFVVGGGSSVTDRKNTALFTTSSIVLSGSVFISGSLLVNGNPPGEGGGASVTITGSVPSGSKASGSLWWNENDGNLYIQVVTPTGSIYVPATNTVAGGNYGATLTTARTGSTWDINHNLNTLTPLITVYSGSSVMIPADIVSVDANNTRITFSGSVTGTAVLSTGIGNETANLAVTASFAQTASFVNTLNQNVIVTGSITATGDLISAKSIGNEGGDILLAKSQTNNSITGSGIVIDSFRNTIRIFEQGGATRGGYYDITQLATTSNTNLYGELATYLHAKKSGTQAIGSGGTPIISGYATPTVSINTAEWNGTTGIFTATKAGTYLVSAQVQYTTATYNGSSELSVGIGKNGVGLNGTSWFSFDAGFVGIPATIQCSAIVTLVPGNEVYVLTFNGSNSGKTVQASGTAITIQELPTRIFR